MILAYGSTGNISPKKKKRKVKLAKVRPTSVRKKSVNQFKSKVKQIKRSLA